MAKRFIRQKFPLEGMSCAGCEGKVERILRRVSGVQEVKADFSSGSVTLVRDPDEKILVRVKDALEREGYFPTGMDVVSTGNSVLDAPQSRKKAPETFSGKTSTHSTNAMKGSQTARMSPLQFAGLVVAVLAIVLVVNGLGGFSFLPEVTSTMGLGMLFLVGILTSVHCVAMCGGIVLSQCLPAGSAGSEGSNGDGGPALTATSTLRPGLLYNSGRVVSYTLVGGLAGALGSVVSFSGWARGAIAVVAGLVMMVMGIQMLGLFPGLARFIPRIPRFLRTRAESAKQGKGPFLVGLLNGLMPCGPLQAMQIYALGTGSLLLGAASMFFFSLGTVPLLLGLGAASAVLGRRFTARMMKVGAVLVLALGVVMIGRGFTLSGFAPVAALGQTPTVTSGADPSVKEGVQVITTVLTSAGYPEFTVTQGVPVHWNLKVPAGTLTGCNKTVVVPAYKIQRNLKVGDNWIDFTPISSGTVPFSCWMGMIQSQIHVVDATS
jgi:sulfite exporter TauE/SafE/copper chaperone CopZ